MERTPKDIEDIAIVGGHKFETAKSFFKGVGSFAKGVGSGLFSKHTKAPAPTAKQTFGAPEPPTTLTPVFEQEVLANH